MSGVTPEGFKTRRLPEIRDDVQGELRDSFGDIDLRDESIWGQQVGIYSELHALLWALAEDVYLSQYPDSASGVSLDHVASLTGVRRIAATPTQVTAQAYGRPNTNLLSGREASNERTGDVYRSTETVRINAEDAVEATVEVTEVSASTYTISIRGDDYSYSAGSEDGAEDIAAGLASEIDGNGLSAEADGEFVTIRVGDFVTEVLDVSVGDRLELDELGVNVPMLAIETGAKLLPAGDLTEIETPVAGWRRVGNLDEGITGTNRETDSVLRARRQQSIQITATNTLDAITARLRQTPLVTDVQVYENTGTDTDEIGVPRQHIWAIVEGGADDDVAEVIYNTRAGGIGMRGNTEVLIRSDESERDYQIRFDRPRYFDPSIVVIYTVLDGAPKRIDTRIREALKDKTFTIGEPVIYSRLWGIITCEVPGVQIDALEINGATGNITVDPDQKVRFLGSNITVEEQ